MYPGSSFAGAVRQGMKHLCKRNVTYDSGCKLHKQAPETGLKGLKAVPLDIDSADIIPQNNL